LLNNSVARIYRDNGWARTAQQECVVLSEENGW
jgi:hypothetical protein